VKRRYSLRIKDTRINGLSRGEVIFLALKWLQINGSSEIFIFYKGERIQGTWET
jgi:hypothetical protein